MTAPGYVAAKLVGGDMGILPEASTLGDGERNTFTLTLILRHSDYMQPTELLLTTLLMQKTFQFSLVMLMVEQMSQYHSCLQFHGDETNFAQIQNLFPLFSVAASAADLRL
jgi:hypothetical protein